MSYRIEWDDQFLECMIFLYKTRKCPLWKKGTCSDGRRCFDSHNQNCRRRPCKDYNGRWNYGTEKCTLGYPDNHENCRDGRRCYRYHNSDEFRYHPLQYKILPCNDPQFKETGICSRGAICWEYHDDSDRRTRHGYCKQNISEAGLAKGSPPPKKFLNWKNNHNKQQPNQQSNQPSNQQSNQQSNGNNHHNNNNYNNNNYNNNNQNNNNDNNNNDRGSNMPQLRAYILSNNKNNC